MASLIYSSPPLLELALRIKYRRFYHIRLARVAQEVDEGAKVVDLCSGDSAIYLRYLWKKRVDYLGIEINPRMARLVRQKGVKIITTDARTYTVPPCDVLLCLASLYQFSKETLDLIRSAQQAANKIVLLEPIENLAGSRYPLLASLAAKITDFGEGPISFRFQEDELIEMWRHLGFSTIARVGPELLGVWNRSAVVSQ